MKQRGITLTEVLVLLSIVGIVAVIAIPITMGVPLSNGNISYGVNGLAESRCIEGYKFVIDDNGNARQILDEFGKGVRCGDTSGAVANKPSSN